jgi:hypothetical protein
VDSARSWLSREESRLSCVEFEFLSFCHSTGSEFFLEFSGFWLFRGSGGKAHSFSSIGLRRCCLVARAKEGGWQKLRWREKLGGGRYRIRTYDFHRVKMALYR